MVDSDILGYPSALISLTRVYWPFGDSRMVCQVRGSLSAGARPGLGLVAQMDQACVAARPSQMNQRAQGKADVGGLYCQGLRGREHYI